MASIMRTSRSFAPLVCAAAGLLAAANAAAAEPAIDARIAGKQAEVSQIVAAISADRIDAHIRKLVSFKTRHTLSDTTSDSTGIGAARRWIKAELERCGDGKLDVRFDSYVQQIGRASCRERVCQYV